jgi:hypothetical protein
MITVEALAYLVADGLAQRFRMQSGVAAPTAANAAAAAAKTPEE